MTDRMSSAELAVHMHAIGITVSQLAELLGITPRAIRRWENEDRQVSPAAATLLRDEVKHARAAAREAMQRAAAADKGAAVYVRRGDVGATAALAHVLLDHPDLRVEYVSPAAHDEEETDDE